MGIGLIITLCPQIAHCTAATRAHAPLYARVTLRILGAARWERVSDRKVRGKQKGKT